MIVHHISCDECGATFADRTYRNKTPFGTLDRSRLRELAVRAGWAHNSTAVEGRIVEHKDFCPQCFTRMRGKG